MVTGFIAAVLMFILSVTGCCPTAAAESADNSAEAAYGHAFFTETCKINGYNKDRGEDDLIVFTRERGKTTGTNEWGYEVTVIDGVITNVGGNNTDIPENGFVLSGHHHSSEWLQEKAKPGLKAVVDKNKNEVTITFGSDELGNSIQMQLDALREDADDAKKKFALMDYGQFEKLYAEAAELNKRIFAEFDKSKNEKALVEGGNKVAELLLKARMTLCESYPVQYRAAWVRASEKTPEEVDAYVNKLHRSGINTICLEAQFAGAAVMNVPKDSLIEHNPDFNFDVLKAYIDACHKRGMELHLWMRVFYSTTKTNPHYDLSIAKKKPEWMNLNNKGKVEANNGFEFIDPANEEARKYLLSFYEYILKNYDIDALEIDYIRYSDKGEEDFGYTRTAMDQFKKRYGYKEDPKFDTKADYWPDWVQFRKDCVSDMAKAVRDLIDRVKPRVLLSADVGADPVSAGENLYQDYMRWLKEGWIDLLHPMAYGKGFQDSITRQVDAAGDRTMVAVGLGSFMDTLTVNDIVGQAIRDYRLGADGDAFFEGSAFMKKETGKALKQSIYRRDALPPFLDPDASVKAWLDYMKERINKLILPDKGMTDKEAKTVIAAIDAAADTVKDAKIGKAELKTLYEKLQGLANQDARQALEADLYHALKIICVKNRCAVSDLIR